MWPDRWWFGAEDMFIPSFYSVFFDLAILGVALTARVGILTISYHEQQRMMNE
jgi:hypothetical protein